MIKLETELTLEQNMSLDNNNTLQEKQDRFLQTTMGKVINGAVDIGLKYILPDLIEDEVINVKNTILESGFKEGISKAVSSAINLGKSAKGIFTGNFENAEQIDIAIKSGGIIDSVSDALDIALKNANKNGKIDSELVKVIKKEKNVILKEVSKNIEDTIKTQVKSIKKVEEYFNKWENFYNEQDFTQMEKAYKNMEKYLDKIIPLENTIKQARRIENLHNLIKNNGKNFDLTEDEKRLAEELL